MQNAAFRRAPKVEIDEEDDEEDEDKPAAVPAPPRGVASLSMSLAHSSMVVARAVSQGARSLRRRKLRRPTGAQ